VTEYKDFVTRETIKLKISLGIVPKPEGGPKRPAANGGGGADSGDEEEPNPEILKMFLTRTTSASGSHANPSGRSDGSESDDDSDPEEDEKEPGPEDRTIAFGTCGDRSSAIAPGARTLGNSPSEETPTRSASTSGSHANPSGRPSGSESDNVADPDEESADLEERIGRLTSELAAKDNAIKVLQEELRTERAQKSDLQKELNAERERCRVAMHDRDQARNVWRQTLNEFVAYAAKKDAEDSSEDGGELDEESSDAHL
jgi:hypothetical protein